MSLVNRFLMPGGFKYRTRVFKGEAQGVISQKEKVICSNATTPTVFPISETDIRDILIAGPLAGFGYAKSDAQAGEQVVVDLVFRLPSA